MLEEFGPMSKVDVYPQVGKSNMFIGYYLRLFWLLEENENQRVLDETLQIFYPMAMLTGTLWEHNDSHASCNHGFTSVIAVVLLRALVGFKEIKDGKLIFDKNFVKNNENMFEIFYNDKKIQ